MPSRLTLRVLRRCRPRSADAASFGGSWALSGEKLRFVPPKPFASTGHAQTPRFHGQSAPRARAARLSRQHHCHASLTRSPARSRRRPATAAQPRRRVGTAVEATRAAPAFRRRIMFQARAPRGAPAGAALQPCSRHVNLINMCGQT